MFKFNMKDEYKLPRQGWEGKKARTGAKALRQDREQSTFETLKKFSMVET